MKGTSVSTMTETAPELAKAIEARRKELGLAPGELAQAAGVSVQGLAPLRKGVRKQYQDRLTLSVCRVLGWTPDSIERLLRGEPAQLVEVSQLDDVAELRAHVAELSDRVAVLQRLVDGLLDDAAERASQSSTVHDQPGVQGS